MRRSVNDQTGDHPWSEREARADDPVDDPVLGFPGEPGASSANAGGSSVEESPPDPAAYPTPQFRDHLHRALEETHRQQAARRMLGAHYSAYQRQRDEQRRQRWLLVLLTALVASLVFVAIRRRGAETVME